MDQPSRVGRLVVIFVGAHVALANLAWAAAPSSQQPLVVRKALVKSKPSAVVDKKSLIADPRINSVPRPFVQASDGSTLQHHPNGTTTMTGKDGTVTDVWPDGTVVTSHPDGSMEVNRPNGQTDFYGKDRR